VPPRESYFLKADPVRGLQIFQQELERLTVLEPRLQDATERLVEHIASLPSEDADVLVPLLWLQGREHFGNPVTLTIICNLLADAGWTVQVIDDALATTLRQDILRDVVREAKRQEATSGSELGHQLERARSELPDFSSDPVERKGAGLAVAALAAAAAGAYVGYKVAHALLE
jgi:hypothetical protein